MRLMRDLLFSGLVSLLVSSIPLWAAQDSPERADEKKPDLPLEAARRLQFTTSEATWLHVDVSPDGQTLLFDILGDLYTLPIEGGTAERITEGFAYDTQARYSPDGQWIVFLSDRNGADNVWLAKPDGSEPRKLTKEKGSRTSFISPDWTPDSRYVVVSKTVERQGLHLFLYHVNGGSGINLTASRETAAPSGQGPPAAGGSFSRLGASFSPDGQYVYYARRSGGGLYNQMSFGWQVYRRDVQEGDVDVVTRAQGGAFRPMVSPDGSKLVYGTRYEASTGLRILDLSTGEDDWLIYPVQRDDMESRAAADLLPGYAFTPDGAAVVLSYGGKLHRVEVASRQASDIAFEAEVNQGMGPALNFPRRVEEGPVKARLIRDPEVSPDGSKLAFSALARLYVMDLAGGEITRLTDREMGEFMPSWSPDGRWIAFVTWNDTGGHLWKVASDGNGTPERLSSVPMVYADPVFSPDGSRMVALRGNPYVRLQTSSEFGGLNVPLDLIWIPSSGGEARLIAPARGVGDPHFGPEPDRVYVQSQEGLVSMRYDGTDRRNHVRIRRPATGPGAQPEAQDILIHPDGRWALARVQHQVWVVPIPLVDGQTVNVLSPSLPVKRLTDVGADFIGWADGGRTVTWSVGSTFYRRPFDSISFRSEESEEAGEAPDEEAEAEEQEEGKQAEEEEAKKPAEEHESVTAVEVVVEFERHQPEGTLVVRGATVITMNGDQVIDNADIAIRDNRIAAIGPRGDVPIPAGSEIFDVSGQTIVPGFVDTHAHFMEIRKTLLDRYDPNLLACLAYGVTTGLDVQVSIPDTFIYQDLIDAGIAVGPRAYTTGPGVWQANNFKSKEQALNVLSKYKKHYRTSNIKAYVSGNRRERQLIAQAALELEMMPTTEGALDLKMDLTHALDGLAGNEHTLPIVPLYKDVVELYSQSGIGYTPTLLVLYGGPWAENFFYETTEVHDDAKLNRFTPHSVIDAKTNRRPWFRDEEHSFRKSAEQAAKIIRAGGRVGVGSHGQLQGLGYHWELWALASGGLTPMEALRAATLNGAKIVGLAQDVGSLEAGKLADLVILEQNPLDDIRNTNTIRYVMKNGELFEGDTLKQVWPVQKELPKLWWWDEKPAHRTGLEW